MSILSWLRRAIFPYFRELSDNTLSGDIGCAVMAVRGTKVLIERLGKLPGADVVASTSGGRQALVANGR